MGTFSVTVKDLKTGETLKVVVDGDSTESALIAAMVAPASEWESWQD